MIEHKKLSAMEWYDSEKSGFYKAPLPLKIIPNYMGINFCAVDSIQWVRQTKDNQLISLTINFKPHDFDSKDTYESNI